jgi:hypothetical protein
MASVTKVFKVRKKLKNRKQGRARKNRLAKLGTTPTQAVFFGDKPAS